MTSISDLKQLLRLAAQSVASADTAEFTTALSAFQSNLDNRLSQLSASDAGKARQIEPQLAAQSASFIEGVTKAYYNALLLALMDKHAATLFGTESAGGSEMWSLYRSIAETGAAGLRESHLALTQGLQLLDLTSQQRAAIAQLYAMSTSTDPASARQVSEGEPLSPPGIPDTTRIVELVLALAAVLAPVDK